MKGRIIVAGDIHGCAAELRELLDLLSPGSSDTLISVGDFCGKGPDVVGALDLWRMAGGSSVLGNNDDRVLAMAEGRTREEPRPEDLPLLRRDDLIEWLATLPLWLSVPEAGCAVVHGGFLPGRAVEAHDQRRDREAVMKLRAVRRDTEGRWSYVPKREARSGDPFWATVWDGEARVIYGHTPQESGQPRFDRRTVGIDTSCVYGRRLTALVIEPDADPGGADAHPQFEPPAGRWSFVSVRAHRQWADAPQSFSVARDQQRATR